MASLAEMTIMDVGDLIRFKVTYLDKAGKKKTTEVSATGKIQAAYLVLNVMGGTIQRVTPIPTRGKHGQNKSDNTGPTSN